MSKKKREPPKITKVNAPRVGKTYSVPHIPFNALGEAGTPPLFPVFDAPLRFKNPVYEQDIEHPHLIWDFRFMTEAQIKMLMQNFARHKHKKVEGSDTAFRQMGQVFDPENPADVRRWMSDGHLKSGYISYDENHHWLSWHPRTMLRQLPPFPTYWLIEKAVRQPDLAERFLWFWNREEMLDLKGCKVRNNRCPHSGFPLRGIPPLPCGEIVCPAHGLIMKDGVVVNLDNLIELGGC